MFKSLRDAWQGLVFVSRWGMEIIKTHPVATLFIAVGLTYGWWLSILNKRKQNQLLDRQLAAARRSDETRAREEEIEAYEKEIDVSSRIHRWASNLSSRDPETIRN